jgi:hypothetical protein
MIFNSIEDAEKPCGSENAFEKEGFPFGVKGVKQIG